jgi:protein-S-isoprenylcysteine O-methyltransferase Ste14
MALVVADLQVGSVLLPFFSVGCPISPSVPLWQIRASLRVPHRSLIAGIAAVAIARYQLGNYFTLSPQARTLVTHGLYRKIRNPVYIFSAIAIATLFIYINRPI